MFENIIKNVHNRHPLIHCITNYVSINDCANIVLACGGAPIMAEDINEVSQITSICQGLDINIGMLNDNKLSSMLKAGATANELGIPVILDPVGAGSSDYRIKAVQNLMSNVQFGVIRGNVSEIKAIAAKQGIHNIAAGVYDTMQKDKSAMGVEAGIADKITDDNIKEMADFINKLSQKTGAVIAVTGRIDMVADENRVYAKQGIHNISAGVYDTMQKDKSAMGVEAGIADKITDDNIKEMADFINKLSQKTGAVIAVTGRIDMVADENRVYAIRNGHKMMSLVTGAGCQLSALTSAYVAADKEHILESVCAAVSVMGISGELAYRRMAEVDGNASYRNYIIDAVYNMTDETLKELGRIERI